MTALSPNSIRTWYGVCIAELTDIRRSIADADHSGRLRVSSSPEADNDGWSTEGQ
ncbi:hypothetical protein [Hyphomicrobium sp.]|uniref:hypothetical protein n=1 Tax=Hyphomicrobium sp. TaxID=82 RepID=UPI0025B92DEC|nr:hypothetical protein [Hyphomicrobium sp.]